MDGYGAIVLFRGCAALVVCIILVRLVVMAIARFVEVRRGQVLESSEGRDVG